MVIFIVWIVYIPLEQKVNLNLESSEDTKILELSQSGLSMFTISSFKSIENKHDVHSGRDCIKTFCESLKEIAMKIINFKKMEQLTNEQWKSYRNAKNCYNCKEKHLKINMLKIKNIVTLKRLSLYKENIEELNIAYVI